MSATRRFISTARVLRFSKESANLSPLTKPTSAAAAGITTKWSPSNGNTFRSFAEYRLKVVNQSPFGLRSKATISTSPHINVKREAN